MVIRNQYLIFDVLKFSNLKLLKMKKVNLAFVVLCTVLSIFSSCVKTEVSPAKSVIAAPIPNAGNGVPKDTWNVIHNSDGSYTSSYGGGSGGVYFGNSLVLPTIDPTGSTDGLPIYGITYVSDATYAHIGIGSINGPYFDIVIPTLNITTSGRDQIKAYQENLAKFENHEIASMPDPQTMGSGVYTTEIKGMLICDHNSPTGASICPITPLPVINHFLIASTVKSGYNVDIYGPFQTVNGTSYSANQVIVKKANGTQLVVSNFGLSYIYNSTTQKYHVVGNIHFFDGSTYVTLTFSDDISTAPQYLFAAFSITSHNNHSYYIQLYGTSTTNGTVDKVVVTSPSNISVSSWDPIVYTLNTDPSKFDIGHGSILLANGDKIDDVFGTYWTAW